MAARFIFNPVTLATHLRDVTERTAERVASKWRARADMHELHTDDPRTGVVVEALVAGHRVLSRLPVAHIDEWGGDEVHSTPTGALRSAAIEEGRFVPAEKP